MKKYIKNNNILKNLNFFTVYYFLKIITIDILDIYFSFYTQLTLATHLFSIFKKLPKNAHKAAKIFDFLLLNDTNFFFTQNLRKKLAVKSF